MSENKSTRKRLIANLKEDEEYLLKYCLEQDVSMSDYIKSLVRADMDNKNEVSSKLTQSSNQIIDKILELIFEKNYSLVAPSVGFGLGQTINIGETKINVNDSEIEEDIDPNQEDGDIIEDECDDSWLND